MLASPCRLPRQWFDESVNRYWTLVPRLKRQSIDKASISDDRKESGLLSHHSLHAPAEILQSLLQKPWRLWAANRGIGPIPCS